MTDQDDIRFRFLVETKESLDNIAEISQRVEEIKQQLAVLAVETGANIKVIAQAMLEAFSAKLQFPGMNEEQIAQAKDVMSQYQKAMSVALQEIQQIDKQSNKATIDNLRDAQKQKVDIVTQSQKEIKQQILSTAQAEKDAQKAGAEMVQHREAELEQQILSQQQLGTQTKSTISVLLGWAKAIFGVYGAYQILRKIIQEVTQFLQEATKAGLEFVKAIYQMEVGVRVLQRTGVDITIQDVYENLDILRDKFKIFTTKELVVGSAAFLNLIRDFGFTKEQIFELQDAIATLAVVNGRAMDEVQRTVALAISSGYTEGLQRLGVSINRVTIAEKAAEMGWKGGYNALTEIQRGLATYTLLIEKTLPYHDDLAQYYKTLPGQIDATTKAIEEQQSQLGTALTPIKLFGERIKLDIVGRITDVAKIVLTFKMAFDAIKQGIDNVGNSISSFTTKLIDQYPAIKSLVEIYKFLKFEFKVLSTLILLILNPALAVNSAFEIMDKVITGVSGKLIEFIDNLENAPQWLKDIASSLRSIQAGNFADLFKGMLGDETISAAEQLELAMEKASDIISDKNDEILALEEDAKQEREDLWMDYVRDLQKILRDGARREEEIEIDKNQRILKIIRDAQYEAETAQLKYANDVKEVWDDYNREVENASIEHNDKLLQIEEDYQENLRRLREDFLFDLEETLRDRDARAVLRLVRKYNLDKSRLDRERASQVGEESRRLAEQLRELEGKRDERLQNLADELAERLFMIRRNRDREIREEKIRTQQEIDELHRNMQAQRDERFLSYKQQLSDLNAGLEEKSQLLAESLAKDLAETGLSLKQIEQLFYNTYGSSGVILNLMKQFAAAYAQYVSIIKGMAKTWDWKSPITGGAKSYNPPQPPGHTPKAEGGSILAMRPTRVLMGETPELATFTPLTRVGRDEGKLTVSGNLPIGQSTATAQVEIFLGAGLEARIVDKAMNETANVIIHRLR